MALTTAQIQNAYVAFFNRPADVAGLTYWSSYAGSSGDLLNTFAKSAEYNALYAGLNNTQLVNAVYQNLFGRAPDPAGLTYWVTQLDTGKVTIGNAANTIQTGAQGSDKTIIDNKVAAATAFTTALDTTAEIVGYAGASSSLLGQVKAWLSGVTADSASLTAAQASIPALTTTVAGGTNEAGASYVLTAAQDILTGTTGNDNFRAVAGNATGTQDQTTLNSSDIIDGGAGSDALIVNLNGNYGGGARIKNIETLQIGTNQAAVAFDYNVNAGSNEVTGVKTIVADQINTGEALTINNLVRDDASTAIPTLSWINDNTGANGLAGTVNVNYRAATVSGTADVQDISLTNVRAGTLNLATGIEKVTLTSAGTATNSIAQIASGTTLTDVVIKADAQLGGARVVSTAAATAGLEINQNPTNANTQTTSFVNLGASVKTVTAEGSKAGVNVAFTDAATDNTFTGGDGNDTVIVNGGNDKLSGGKGDDTFIFRQTNTSANGSFFNNSDTLDGGDGKDTILIDYAKDSAGVQNQVVIQTSEWLNSKGLDVLDLRATNTRVQLDDAFVGRNDVGSFEVVTNKIVQNDSTSSVADEANSRHQIDLTTVGASRAVKVTGGEGRETVIVTDALNGVQTISGGNGLDVLVVQNGATLTGQDLSNVSGVNVFNLVKTSGNAQSYQIDLTSAFLDKAVDATAAAGTSKNTANAFRILTDTADGSGTAISGVQTLAAGDTINITVDTTGLTTAGAINIDDLIASGATVIVKNTSGTTLYSNQVGNVVAGTGIFAGASAVNNTAYTNLTANPVAGVGTPVASGQASSGGTGGTSGTTITSSSAVTVSNLVPFVSGTESKLLTDKADTITINGTLGASVIVDATTGDGDVLNTQLTGASTATVTGIETLNLTTLGGSLNLANVTGNSLITVKGTNVTFTGAAATDVFSLGSDFTGTADITGAAGTDAYTVKTSAANFILKNTTSTALTLENSGASTVDFTGSAALATVNVKGTGTVELKGLIAATTKVDASTLTGNLVYNQTVATDASVVGGSGNDTFNFNATGTLTTADTVNGGAGTDTINYSGNLAANGLDNVTNVEVLNLTGSGANVYTTLDTLVAFGQTLTVNAASTGSLNWAGGAETNGAFIITAGIGADTIVGGANADTINGGAGNDLITGGLGGDRIDVGTGTDTVLYTAAGQTTSFATAADLNTATTAGTLQALAGVDVISGLGSADVINLSGIANTFTGATGTTVAAASANTASLVRGTWDTAAGTFSQSGTGADSLFVFDADANGGGAVVNAVVLLGVTSAATGAAGVFTFA